jgi:preprotein translocase subunit SecG
MISWQFAGRQIDRLIHELVIFSPPERPHSGSYRNHWPCADAAWQGADMGAAFGSGASGSLFGATGSANFLSRTTGVLAAVFFLTSLGLAYIGSSKPKTTGSVMQEAVQSQPVSQPTSAGVETPQSPVVRVPRQKIYRSNASDSLGVGSSPRE